MELGIVGSGNVAEVLGKQWKQCGHNISFVAGRNKTAVDSLAEILAAESVCGFDQLAGKADIYIIAIADPAIQALAAQLRLGDALVLHTAGSVSKEILADASTAYGVLWPMKMIRKGMNWPAGVEIVVDANSDVALGAIKQLAADLSDLIHVADDATRAKMHLVAAVTSNFSNHIYHLAAQFCQQQGLDFSIFQGIIEDTVQGLRRNNPKEQQAGAAFRGDTHTLEKHDALLNRDPALQQLYRTLSDSILQTYGYPAFFGKR
jgi:predicted short-subunit dehydrogenase-like oxidoreductase (DUF2520 family)